LIAPLFVPQRAAADDDDPPTRVARLSYTHGAVSFQPGGTDDWVSAVVNRPLTTGDKLWSDNGARAELHIGSASIRLASNTGLSFLSLNDDVSQIRLTAGTLRVRVKRLGENETFEVDTPNLAFSSLRPGIYRINVSDNADVTVIRVRGGEGEVTSGGFAYAVHAREIGRFTGPDQLEADVESYSGDDDDFDSWCAQRDRHEDLSISARYVSPDVIGYEDLDDYGGWRPVPGYGTVWFPHTTIIGWAPYRYGHWAYVYPWGYTWIDDSPWGFAPFHYGRWIFVGGVWGWVPCPPPAPGVVYVRPVYAPALVAWVGGPHFAFGFSAGGFATGVNVGWFPLGPREVYIPAYPVSRTYVNNVNISNTTVNTTVINNYYNVTVIHQAYVNQGVAGAVTATTPQAFTSAQPVAKNVVQVNQKEVSSAPVNAVAPAAAPGKQAVLGSGTIATVKPPNSVQNRAVVAKITPPPPPVPFARQQKAIEANGGKPLAMSQFHQLQPENARSAHANVKIAPAATQTTPRGNTGNANVGNKSNTTNTGQPGASDKNAGNQSGYRKFDDRPPSARPTAINAAGSNTSNSGGNVNNAPIGNISGLDARHQQQLEQLQTKHDQKRQKMERQQQDERGKLAQKSPDLTKQQQLNQKHQQQLENLEKKHDAERQKLEQKQQQERNKHKQAN
jgi:hypothetical protein